MGDDIDVSSADRTGRRRLLTAAGVGLAVALAGCSGNGEGEGTPTGGGTTDDAEPTTDGGTTTPTATEGDDGEGTASPTRTPAQVLPAGTEIRMGAEATGWSGRAPASIDGRMNPTLYLEADAQYTFVWENLDGVEHELYIATESDTVVVESESAEDEGETVRTTFTARPSMTTYYCEYHPQGMRGNVVVE